MRLAITAFAVLATATAALAEGPGFPASQKGFVRMDADKNGEISLNELVIPAEKRFLRYDSNGDKAVSAEEIDARFKAAYERRRDKMLKMLDANQDGTITEAELQAYITLQFTSADADKNGSLTLQETQEARLAMRKQMRETYAKKGQQPANQP